LQIPAQLKSFSIDDKKSKPPFEKNLSTYTCSSVFSEVSVSLSLFFKTLA